VTREEEGTQPAFWPVYGTGKACDEEVSRCDTDGSASQAKLSKKGWNSHNHPLNHYGNIVLNFL
jgi:hypothetical protein